MDNFLAGFEKVAYAGAIGGILRKALPAAQQLGKRISPKAKELGSKYKSLLTGEKSRKLTGQAASARAAATPGRPMGMGAAAKKLDVAAESARKRELAAQIGTGVVAGAGAHELFGG